MNSSIYTCKVVHNRLSPKKHSFWYNVYMFYLDLDEIDLLVRKMRWMSRNRFNLFSFRDKDHLQLPRENPNQSKRVREHLTQFLFLHDVQLGNGRVMLLTNLSVLGYNFNPVSFYFCYDERGEPLCAVAEISNTFREMKLFYLGKEKLSNGRFKLRTEKYFYVSPFVDLDVDFDLNLGIPDEKLDIRIDDYDKEGNRFFLSILTGSRKALDNGNLLRYFFSIPLIPLWIMALIHWQAFKIWRKKISFHRKAANQEMQKDVYRTYKPN